MVEIGQCIETSYPKDFYCPKKIDSRGRKGTLVKQTNVFKGYVENGEFLFLPLNQIVCVFFFWETVEHVEYVESLSLFQNEKGGLKLPSGFGIFNKFNIFPETSIFGFK